MKCLRHLCRNTAHIYASATMLPPLVKAYDDAMQAQMAGNSMLDVISANEPEVGIS
jgi:hypothetical protein